MGKYYSDEKNAQIVIALLKEHRIRKVIASPGTTNMALVVSMQNDPFFEMYSSVDERSAAYMACGLSAETQEPVVLSCTGATAARNYLPGLTEAFYRKLPILVITASHEVSKVGHNVAQIIDSRSMPKDTVKLSVDLPVAKDKHDIWTCEIGANQAILELSRNGGGPVHINLPTTYSRSFNTKELPKVRVIQRINSTLNFPELQNKRIAVFIGAHSSLSNEETELIDRFCQSNNAAVFCDHTSSYNGKYKILYSIVACQKFFNHRLNKPDICIYLGEITGDYYSPKVIGKEVWRVSEDGEIRDVFKKTKYVFEVPEKAFFEYYTKEDAKPNVSYFEFCENQVNNLRSKLPELPFSNIWVASKLSSKIPEGSVIHFGILNSLRSWNFFDIPASVSSFCNVGGFGIDGNLSSLIGASFNDNEKLYFGIIGDLAFFYDMNALGNRHVGKNLRILLINNGVGTEFRHNTHRASVLGDDADDFVAARGHFGKKSNVLVKHYAEDLGFDYLCASNKKDFENCYDKFVSIGSNNSSIIFEVFTDSQEESNALDTIMELEESVKGRAKDLAKNILGKVGVKTLKSTLGK